jgi:hypothetical protein
VTRIRGVAVVVPARDEQDTVAHCMRGIERSVQRLPRDVVASVTVVLDRCTDGTSAVVAAEFSGRPDRVAWPLSMCVGTGVGAVRHVGIQDALVRMRLPAEEVWVLNTDADSVVPPDWAVRHLHQAATGAVAVAGTVELAGPGADLHVACEPPCGGDRHGHVYGANLGVRADAYLAVGGFVPDGPGEDAALWRSLRAAGLPVVSPTSVRVRTSARLHGRATGGLADLLRARRGA